ncbi:IclR family transcriptional regulator [Pollutimonas harenae]|uniref:IclR family transcriptional regulator n=1 Tax=Pollutimonas harenae TaxID=657015 RepID=A0A853H063_9BURK|nr:IclR family transcriptional regulator [Pollutimonas harenae]NYT85420.1 IclR family transcriptional regulator [Pollutimonas harenae]TEA70514.1 IclR family transcriptional regulator [Pollutimonas harenae]
MKTAKDEISGNTRGRRQRVQAVTTGAAVLKGLASLGGRASLTALAKQISENPAKVHRYLISMMEEGLVAQDPISLQYYLGAGAIQIGLAAMRLAEPLRVAEPALVRLRESLEMTCFIAVMANKGPTIVRFEEPSLPVTLNVRVGSVLPLLRSATGRVFLGFSDDTLVEKLAGQELAEMAGSHARLSRAADPIAAIKKEVRVAGMSIVRGTNLQGISAISVPIHDFSGRVVAALTVLGSTGSFDVSAKGRVALTLKHEGLEISTALGYTGQA